MSIVNTLIEQPTITTGVVDIPYLYLHNRNTATYRKYWSSRFMIKADCLQQLRKVCLLLTQQQQSEKPLPVEQIV